ncbi:hypothetical protein J7T55_004601 [Diaporthe amygdali]|uniref:uncharacterized protein n=1 Tax=Phomopsis amygdali TaxID=1214568 RepID=UPI0022FF03FA|nr:uncharacterized protein J7T55_004601 [Diaporthe amygdali]KAJ0114859.1 hypothetical protein J7T55_004601 [Diaporthe amygdali]
MFRPRSPKPIAKRKRSGADSEPLQHIAALPPRLSPPSGHRNAQALSQRQWQPFLPDTSHDEAHQGLPGRPGRFDTQIQRSDGHENSTAYRKPAKHSIELSHKEQQLEYDHNESDDEDYVPRLKVHCECLFNDNGDGTLSIVGTREENGQGRVVISQNSLSSDAEAPAEPQMGTRASKRRRTISEDLPSSSIQSSPRHATSESSGDDQQAESMVSETAWDAINGAYDCVSTVFTSCPNNKVITFLAGLSARRQALAINTNEGSSKTRQFRLPKDEGAQIISLKAALAQAHGSERTPCPQCADGKGLWRICVQAPTMPDESQDVLRGACPSCYYARCGRKCRESSGTAPEQDLAPPQLMPAMAEYETLRSFSRQHAESVDDTRHVLSSFEPSTRMPVAARPSKQPQLVSMSQQRRDRDTQAPSAKDVPAERVQGEAFSRDQSGSNAAQGPSPIHRAQDGAISQQQSTMDHAQGALAGGQTVQDTIIQCHRMAANLYDRTRGLSPNERAAIPDQVNYLLSLTGLEPEIWGIANRISELPVVKRAEVSRVIIEMMRQTFGSI